MANVLLAFPNLTDSSTLSGGGWQAPLTNLQDRRLARVARTTDCAAGNTQFTVDFGKDRKLQVVSLVSHNMSTQGQWRVLMGDDPTFATTKYDSGWMPAWSVVYPFGTLEWEDDNWWDGTVSQDDRAGYPGILLNLLPAIALARYVQVQFSDTLNPAGYLQFGRLFMSPGWQPAHNMSYGASMGWEADTRVARSLGGTPYFDRKAPRRVDKFTLELLNDAEAKAQVFEMQRKLGVDGELLVAWNPADSLNLIRQSFLGRMRALNPITTVIQGFNSNAFEIEETS
ncbi:hypothetical protein J8I87_05990 [Paraburkholderia sp. LEh10]|uniref:hypothetical protein n=1 Tax=Paraburkholderia sp. LEh10 TaxID=2821353 RepID=UPI001AE51AD7|nr:hypothetical protein [Paraburkholderia sp. LEh10]MBP0589274.1 hypothetical protein [Paraburkholderia sp. LEh10]